MNRILDWPSPNPFMTRRHNGAKEGPSRAPGSSAPPVGFSPCSVLRYTTFRMHSITSLDNLWMGRPRSIAAALLESDSYRAIVDPGPGSTLGSRQLEVVYTPGHASHHVGYFDKTEGVAFVGDTAGVRIEGNSFVMPATPPPDIDLGIWDTSFAAILERKPARLFLTHFGYSDNPSEHIVLFRERL